MPKKLRNFLSRIKVVGSETFSSVSSPIQYAAIEAYTGDYTDYISKTRNILNALGRYVYKNLKSNNILMNPPQGGFYLMPEFVNSKFKTSSDLCDGILNDTGVVLLPGSAFGFNKDRMLTRLSYTDFDGGQFLKNVSNSDKLGNDIIEKYAPNIVEGVNKLSEWSKNL
jgi:aspartate aminotransferase